MFFQRLKAPGLGQNSYVLACGDGLAVVIDPRRDVHDYLRLAREENLSIAYVLETHRQEDFEFGSRTLAQMSGARIVGGSHALFGETDVKLEDDQELKVGTTRFVALETPGHTPESISYAVYVKDAGDKCWGVFTGDALFVGDTGRTDLPDPEKTGENAGILGLMAGSYFYAETSGYLGSTIQKIGNRGRIMLPDLLGMRLAVFLAVFVPLLVLGLFVIAQLARGR